MQLTRKLALVLTLGVLTSTPVAARAQVVISFPDPALNAAVADALHLLPGSPITDQQMLQLTNLQAWWRGITNLSGLEWAANLAKADLTYNAIDDLAPLAGLTNLVSLALSNNRVTDPSPLQGLIQLSSLALDYNLVPNPAVLAGLVNLTNLSLGNCGLRSVGFVEGMSHLQSFSAWGNSVQDLSPLSHCPVLRDLDVSQSQVVAYPSSFPRLANLRMAACNLDELDFLRGAPSLTNLDLTDNFIRDISPISTLTNLSNLNLNENPVNSLAPLARLRRLTSLQLVDCGLVSLRYLREAISLENLVVELNQITDTSPLRGLTNLVELDLSLNPLKDVSHLTNLPALTKLALASCTLTNLSSLHGLSAVRELYIGSNGARDVSPLNDMTNLASLSLVGNAVTNVERLASLRNLTELDLSWCSLSNLGGVKNLTSLEYLNAEQNFLTDCSGLPGLNFLTELHLGGNRLTNIADLLSLQPLWILDISANLLDLSPGSPAMLVISNLNFYFMFTYTPQNQPPQYWVLPTNFVSRPIETVSFQVAVRDDITRAGLVTVAVSSSNTGLVANSAITLSLLDREEQPPSPLIYFLYRGHPPPVVLPPAIAVGNLKPLKPQRLQRGMVSSKAHTRGMQPQSFFPYFRTTFSMGGGVSDWLITVTPSLNQTGSTVLTCTATDDTGLSNSMPFFLTVTPPQALDSTFLNDPALTWQTGGNASWFGQTAIAHDGISAAQSGALGSWDNSWLETTVTGPGVLSFWWKKDSLYYDYAWATFSTSTGGSLSLGGIADWRQESVSIPQGTCVLTWRLESGSVTDSSAVCWLDQVNFLPTTNSIWVEAVSSPPGPGNWLWLHGEFGGLYDVQVSIDLSHWSSIGRILFDAEHDQFARLFHDPEPRTGKVFYRMRPLPPGTTWFDAPQFDDAGALLFMLHGQPERACDILSSTNLLNWSPVLTVTNETGNLLLKDMQPVRSGVFYRARVN